MAKCPYCDFNSHENRDQTLPEIAYVEALLSDLTQEMPDIWGRTISSVFIGGGTPSLFSADAIDKLMSGIRALTALPPSIEITMEANPGTFEQKKFDDFRRAGINRLSIGIQSFNNDHLKALGRIHGRDESLAATDIARQAGFDNINLDLMFGLPGQSTKQAVADIEQAISLAPEHISHYQLTMEPNTVFHKYPPKLPPDEQLWDMQDLTASALVAGGYSRYEISAWSKPRKQSVHNTNYWLFGDYVGIGAGAHGKISFADNSRIIRRSKVKQPNSYLQKASSSARIGEEHDIQIQDTGLEFMMNALRLTDGFNPTTYFAHTGLQLFSINHAIDNAIAAGLLESDVLSIKASARGFDFLNDLLQHFMPEEDESRDEQKFPGGYPLIRLHPQD